MVAPLAGAWIEIYFYASQRRDQTGVAPLAGAWIEILGSCALTVTCSSLPSRERGLKSDVILPDVLSVLVAPLAGAWIEI